ncbi:MAG: hypothetical protein ABSG03_30375 [Bryobacteraceae bacterium]|jgi:hypothetical protein
MKSRARINCPDAITNALAYNATTGDFYALTYVNELFAFARAGIG